MNETAPQRTNQDLPQRFHEGFSPLAPPSQGAQGQTSGRQISINRHVNYTMPDGTVRAAIVTAAGPTYVDLAVLLPGESHVLPVRNVVEGTTPDTWHWPAVI